jgi:hypothetical protein
MASAYTALLGLVLPVQGELQGQWGNTVNNELTSLLDTAIAGTTTISADADVTLTDTDGTANQARQAIILWTANGSTTRNITAPAQSKSYVVINKSAGTQSIVIRGVGPTTGVTILKGEQAVVAWDGSDFVKVSTFGGSPSFTNVTVTGTTTLSGLTASTALALNASKEVVSVTNTGTGNNVLSASPTLTGTVAGASMTLSSLTSGRVTYAGASGLLQDSANLTFDGTTLTAANFADSSLTSGRVTYAGASGNLSDSANLTFNGTDLTVSGAVNAGSVNATTLDLTNIEVTNIKAKDGTSAATIADSTGVVSFTANPTLSAGTANGVAYLNGSKVLTSGSALTFDGSNLVSTGAGTFSSLVVSNASGTLNTVANAAPRVFGSTSVLYNAAAQHIWETGGLGSPSEQMRLTSTGLGIGTSSPGAKLDVRGNATFTGNATARQTADFTNTGGQLYVGTESSAGGAVFTGSSAYAGILGTNNATPLQLATNGATRATLDSSGNLGLGVTPSAWSGAKALQISGGGLNGALYASSTGVVGLTNNYYNAGGDVYVANGFATRYYQLNGQHVWNTAPSGTAGNTISFTQAMTLDASGRLGIGATSPANPLSVSGSTGTIASFTNGATADFSIICGSSITSLNAGGANILAFQTGGTERARITSGGDLLVGTTSGAITVNGLKFLSDGSFYAVQNSGVTSSIYNKSNYTSGTDFFADFRLANTTVGSISANGSTTSYNISSDRRLKKNVAPAPSASDDIDAIQIISHDWKSGFGEHVKYGVIAQDLHAVAPQAVTAGDDGDEIEKTWGVDYSKLVPMLIKEIQSLRARVAALESN